MKYRNLLLAPLLVLTLACGVAPATPEVASEDAQAAPEVAPASPQRPGITVVEPGTDIREIKSDTFKLQSAVIEGDILKITVQYAGGVARHEFTLYWSGISTRSMPPQLPMVLKHNANGDQAEALITETIEFELGAINQPAVINLSTDHGDRVRVEYGERGE